MKYLPFVIWVLGWPLATSLMDLVEYKISGKQTEEEALCISEFQNIVWVLVGTLLYFSGE